MSLLKAHIWFPLQLAAEQFKKTSLHVAKSVLNNRHIVSAQLMQTIIITFLTITPALSGRKLELSENKSLPSQLQLVNEGLRI